MEETHRRPKVAQGGAAGLVLGDAPDLDANLTSSSHRASSRAFSEPLFPCL